MRKLFLSYFLMTLSYFSFSQDVIIKPNGDEIKAKVLEVTLTIIKFKKLDNLNGPTFEMLKSDIFMIKYENGTKDVFSPTESKSSISKEKPNISSETEKDANEDTEKYLSFSKSHKSTSILYGLSAILGYGAFSDGDGSLDFNSYAIGPVSVIFNKALSDKISVSYGPSVMYYRQGFSYSGGYNNTTNKGSTNLILAAVTVGFNYHFATTYKIDPYVGLGAGVGYYTAFGSSDYGGYGSLKGTIPVLYGARIGISTLNKKKNAWTFELGYDYLSHLKVGYTFIKKK